MTKVLIDTNICLDVVLHRKPFAANALEVTERSELGEFTGMIAAHSFDNLFYLLEKRIGKAKAYKGAKELRRAFEVSEVTQSIIDAALDLNWNDFEDAIHYESARAAGCEAIITRNKKDFERAELQILTPTEFLDQLNRQ